MPVDLNGRLLYKSTEIVAYAFNINILARSTENATNTVVAFDKAAKEVVRRENQSHDTNQKKDANQQINKTQH